MLPQTVDANDNMTWEFSQFSQFSFPVICMSQKHFYILTSDLGRDDLEVGHGHVCADTGTYRRGHTSRHGYAHRDMNMVAGFG